MNEFDDDVKALIRFCSLNNIKVQIISELIQGLSKEPIKMNLDMSGATPIISLKEEALEIKAEKAVKRGFDIAISLGVTVGVLSWLYPLLAILIKLDSKGPVLFVQKRTGLNNRSFSCYKFRTMVVNSDADTKQSGEKDNRITKLGAFLRKTHLDELPQFINVLLGDMSIVGPRPHMIAHTEVYSRLIHPYTERLWIKPGITGLAQANGYSGPTPELWLMEKRVEYDRQYVYSWSVMLDIKIIAQTVFNLLTFRIRGDRKATV